MFENLDARLLARRLRDAGYSFESVADRLGDAAIDALARNTTPATRDALGADTDAQADLIRLFMLHDALPADRVARALGQPAPWVDAGLLAAVAPGGATDLVAPSRSGPTRRPRIRGRRARSTAGWLTTCFPHWTDASTGPDRTTCSGFPRRPARWPR